MSTWLPLLTIEQILQRGAAALIVVAVYGFVLTWAVRLAGDEGPTQDGRRTMAPWTHLDLVGFVVALFYRVTWVLPLDVEVARFRRPAAGVALTLLGAGLAVVALGVVALALRPLAVTGLPGEAGRVTSSILVALFDISVATAVWNLLPLPPLAGSLWWGVARRGAERWARRAAVRWVGVAILVVAFVSGVATAPTAALTRWLRAALGY